MLNYIIIQNPVFNPIFFCESPPKRNNPVLSLPLPQSQVSDPPHEYQIFSHSSHQTINRTGSTIYMTKLLVFMPLKNIKFPSPLQKYPHHKIFLLVMLSFLSFTTQIAQINAQTAASSIQLFAEGEWIASYPTAKNIRITDLWANSENIIAFGTQSTHEKDINMGDSNLILLNWDVNGTLLWSKTIEFTNQDAHSGEVWSDGISIYTLGTVRESDSSSGGWLAKFDFEGNQLWYNSLSRNYGDQGELGLFFYENHLITLVKDSGILVETWDINGTRISSHRPDLGPHGYCYEMWFNGTDIFAIGKYNQSRVLFRFSPQGILLKATPHSISYPHTTITGNSNYIFLTGSPEESKISTFLLDYSGYSISNNSISFPENDEITRYWAHSTWCDGIDFYIAGHGPYEDSDRKPLIFRLNQQNQVIANATIDSVVGEGGTIITGYGTNLYIIWYTPFYSLKLIKLPINLTNQAYTLDGESPTIPIIRFYVTIPLGVLIISMRSQSRIKNKKKSKINQII
jgi:hypothetical protein